MRTERMLKHTGRSFCAVMAITGKQIPDKWLEKINNVGFWLLIALLIYANGNDIFKAFF